MSEDPKMRAEVQRVIRGALNETHFWRDAREWPLSWWEYAREYSEQRIVSTGFGALVSDWIRQGLAESKRLAEREAEQKRADEGLAQINAQLTRQLAAAEEQNRLLQPKPWWFRALEWLGVSIATLLLSDGFEILF